MTFFDSENEQSPKKISFEGTILYCEAGSTHHLRTPDSRFQNHGNNKFCLRRLLEKYKDGETIEIVITKKEKVKQNGKL